MNKEQQELLNAVERHHLMEDAKILPNMSKEKMTELGYGLTQEEFINKCKTDTEFSEKWGLKIEERELSEKERLNTLTQNEQRLIYERVQSFKNVRRKKLKDFLDEQKIPTRLITITYNDKTIESYE
jgi:hypothetical protein